MSGVGPLPFYLLCPGTISLPGIQGRIETRAPLSRCGSTADPLAVLLPTICFLQMRVRVVGRLLGFSATRILYSIVVVIAGPANLFAILHLSLLATSFGRRLPIAGSGSQELHHNAGRHFVKQKQDFTACFYLIQRARSVMSAACLTKRRTGPAISWPLAKPNSKADIGRAPASFSRPPQMPTEVDRAAS